MATRSGGDNPWIWDPNRRDHYYFNHVEQCYIYNSGQRIYQGQGNAAGTQHTGSYEAPRNQEQDYRGSINAAGYMDEDESSLEQAGTGPSELGEQLSGLNLYGTPNYVYEDSYGQTTSGYSRGAHESDEDDESDENEDETDNEADTGSTLVKRIKENMKPKESISAENNDTADPEYKEWRPGKRFFKLGKVFKVYWTEPLGGAQDNVTVTEVAESNAKVASKIRWFIVVKEGKNFCTCVSIKTYGGRGVAKESAIKWHHGMAFTQKEEPLCADTERPSRNEHGMLPGIRIEINHRKDKLHKMSRIDFSRNYTVEHNVKVYDLGWVDRNYLTRLRNQWLYVMSDGDTEGFALLNAIPDADSSSESDEDQTRSKGKERSKSKSKSTSSSSRRQKRTGDRSDKKDYDKKDYDKKDYDKKDYERRERSGKSGRRR